MLGGHGVHILLLGVYRVEYGGDYSYYLSILVATALSIRAKADVRLLRTLSLLLVLSGVHVLTAGCVLNIRRLSLSSSLLRLRFFWCCCCDW